MNYSDRVCYSCGIKEGFISNFPSYNNWTCKVCYLLAIHKSFHVLKLTSVWRLIKCLFKRFIHNFEKWYKELSNGSEKINVKKWFD